MAITKKQYEDKAAPFARREPAEPGLLTGGHGRVVCVCGAVLAACPHVGHEQLIYETRPNCDACVGDSQ